jgi:hypothetical protein
MLAYLRTITIGLLALLAVSSATVVPAMAGQGLFIHPRFGNEGQFVVPARTRRQMCLPIVTCNSKGCWVEPCGIVIVVPGAASV